MPPWTDSTCLAPGHVVQGAQTLELGRIGADHSQPGLGVQVAGAQPRGPGHDADLLDQMGNQLPAAGVRGAGSIPVAAAKSGRPVHVPGQE